MKSYLLLALLTAIPSSASIIKLEESWTLYATAAGLSRTVMSNSEEAWAYVYVEDVALAFAAKAADSTSVSLNVADFGTPSGSPASSASFEYRLKAKGTIDHHIVLQTITVGSRSDGLFYLDLSANGVPVYLNQVVGTDSDPVQTRLPLEGVADTIYDLRVWATQNVQAPQLFSYKTLYSVDLIETYPVPEPGTALGAATAGTIMLLLRRRALRS